MIVQTFFHEPFQFWNGRFISLVIIISKRRMIARFWSLFSLLILFPFMNLAEEKPIGEDGENPFDHLVCREVNYGGGHHQIHQRKFLVLSGLGGGIGNYLIFYPAAYYFAAVTGRVSSFPPSPSFVPNNCFL